MHRERILELVQSQPPLLECYLNLESQLQPNGFDLTLRGVSRFTSMGALGPRPEDRDISNHEAVSMQDGVPTHLEPGPYLITFNEVVNLPLDVMALGRPRSSLLRSGVAVHTAVWDAGYQGRSQALMMVNNPHGFRLTPGAAMVQLVFFALSSPVAEGYRGLFQGENIGQGES